MAMLAEPRRKQKFSVDPRNLNWSNDESKIGQKMMEKMGWSKGKGLGASEQGDVDHISVKVKNDTTGVGCSKKYADNWIAHQDDFNSLLANLHENHSGSGTNTPDAEKVVSLEKSSKASRSRVHYGKFTRGKDLSTRGARELECIFGKKRKTDNEPEKQSSEEEEEEEEEEKPSTDQDQNLITSTQSVADYFAQKMAALQRLRNNKPEEVKAVAEYVKPQYEEKTLIVEKEEVIVEEVVELRKKKKSEEEENISGETEPSSESSDSNVKKGKKKKKKTKCEIVNEELAQIEDEEVIEEANSKKKKKKCKKSRNSETVETVVEVGDSKKKRSGEVDEVDVTNVDQPKKKRRRLDTELDATDTGLNDADSCESTKSKKEKRKKKTTNDISNELEKQLEKSERENLQTELASITTDCANSKTKSRKDKKKSKEKESDTGRRYVYLKKTKEKIYIDDLNLGEKFKGSNIETIKPYGSE